MWRSFTSPPLPEQIASRPISDLNSLGRISLCKPLEDFTVNAPWSLMCAKYAKTNTFLGFNWNSYNKKTPIFLLIIIITCKGMSCHAQTMTGRTQAVILYDQSSSPAWLFVFWLLFSAAGTNSYCANHLFNRAPDVTLSGRLIFVGHFSNSLHWNQNKKRGEC